MCSMYYPAQYTFSNMYLCKCVCLYLYLFIYLSIQIVVELHGVNRVLVCRVLNIIRVYFLTSEFLSATKHVVVDYASNRIAYALHCTTRIPQNLPFCNIIHITHNTRLDCWTSNSPSRKFYNSLFSQAYKLMIFIYYLIPNLLQCHFLTINLIFKDK